MNDNNINLLENNEINKHKKYLEYRKEWVKIIKIKLTLMLEHNI